MSSSRWAKIALLLSLPLLAAAGAEARTGNEPLNTSPPTIAQNGNQLVLSDGSWFSYSGPVSLYDFRFLRDGSLIKGAASVPKSEPWGSPPLVGQYPDDPNANIYPLTSADYGHQLCGDVYGGTHSEYIDQSGNVIYNVIEWGHTLASDGSEVSLACLTPTGPSPPPPTTTPNPQAAYAVWANVTLPARRTARLYASWKLANPREAAALEAYDAAVLARRTASVPALATAAGRSFVASDEQAAWDAGVHA